MEPANGKPYAIGDGLPRRDTAGRKVKPEPTQQGELPDQEAPLLFARDDWSLYTSLATLTQKAGVPTSMLPWLVTKEFADNGLDAADLANVPGAVEVRIDNGNLTVADQGSGIPDATPEQIARLFCVVRPMVSSKLLRKCTRGAVGNGLRVCLGYLTATRGRLIIETGSLRVELAPEIDGTSRIVCSNPIKPRRGLRLTVVAGDAPFVAEHLTWAQDAIELARQSGNPAFTGRPSPHWLDLDHFRVLLRAVVGNVSVRQFLGELDGCSGSRTQTRIAARFLRRPAASLDADEATELLAAAQAATKPPTPKALRPLGRDAVVAGGYAIAGGTFAEGEHVPHAAIPFLVECWADGFFPEEQADRLTSTVFMNRTRAIATCTGNAWHGQLDLSLSGTTLRVPVPAGPHYSITVNITSPMFRLTSDGKTPDCRPFGEALSEAIGNAAKRAGHDIAAQMSAEQKRADARWQQQERKEAQKQRLTDREARQQRLARIEAEKAERMARPTIRDVVLELLPGAVEVEASSGLMFNTRRLVYRIRDAVMRRTSRELTQSYFDDLLTEIEAKHGDLSPLLYREPRGSFLIPHRIRDATPLGTLTVRAFRRPAWTFNKVLLIEKDDLRLMLEQAGWADRHDALLMSSKGFTTRAARDLIDKIGETTEPVQVFCCHDADAAGTVIQHTVQHATLARAARKIEVIDLGLQPWEGVVLGLSVEQVPANYNKNDKRMRRPVGGYVRARTDHAPTGETWEDWLQHSRIELNAFTSAELIAWLDGKMAAHGAGKVIPPDDILVAGFGERVRARAQSAVSDAIDRRLDAEVAAIEAERAAATASIQAEIDRITADLRAQLALASEPFQQRIAAAQAAAAAVDREAEEHKVIKQITPEADRLRAAVGKAFADRPTSHWSTSLHTLADGTALGDVEIDDQGGAP
jgi:DNA topoisomerase VI subunit B